MKISDIEDAAMFLLHLRLQRGQVGGLPGELAPKTIDEAYDIQDATHRFGGWPISMLKVGCTSLIAQQVLGIPHPIGGRIPVEGVFESGATVPRSFLASEPLLECEIALQVGSSGQVIAVAPAIELVNARYLNTSKVSGESIIADNAAGCGVVLGTPIPFDDVGDLASSDLAACDLADSYLADIAMTLHQGTVEIAAGTTAALAGGPLKSLEWTLAHETSRGRSVAPGTWIITGTCTGLTPTAWGEIYTADFGSLGSVRVSLGD